MKVILVTAYPVNVCKFTQSELQKRFEKEQHARTTGKPWMTLHEKKRWRKRNEIIERSL